MADRAQDEENRSLPLWRRYREPALIALVGVVLLGVSAWSVFSGKGVEVILTSAGLGVVALGVAVLAHRMLLRRDRV